MAKSNALYFVRIIQLLISVGFLVIVCWSGVHRGWWENINGALAVGVIAVLFTLGLSVFSIVSHHRDTNPFSGGSVARTALRIGVEVVMFLLYIASVALMFRPKGGCSQAETVNNGPMYCVRPDAKDDILQSSNPATEWNVAIAFAFVQIISYILSAVLVGLDEKSSKVGGGASYA